MLEMLSGYNSTESWLFSFFFNLQIFYMARWLSQMCTNYLGMEWVNIFSYITKNAYKSIPGKYNYYNVRFSGVENILASETAFVALKNWICLIMII